MKKTKRRSLILSVLMMVLSLALVASGTYALFSDQVKMTHHLQAGVLDITLVRTNLAKTALDMDTGYMKTSSVADDPEKDFSNPNGENVFGIIKGKTLIVPCSTYTASMKITNNSDVAFGYWIEIKLDVEGMTQQQIDDLRLDEQIKVTVTRSSGTSEYAILSDGLDVGSEAAPIAKLAKAPTFDDGGNPSHDLQYFDTFDVCVEFLNLDNAINNLAQGHQLNFDLIVHAVQLAEEAPTP